MMVEGYADGDKVDDDDSDKDQTRSQSNDCLGCGIAWQGQIYVLPACKAARLNRGLVPAVTQATSPEQEQHRPCS